VVEKKDATGTVLWSNTVQEYAGLIGQDTQLQRFVVVGGFWS
jgi:hypothetical protein